MFSLLMRQTISAAWVIVLKFPFYAGDRLGTANKYLVFFLQNIELVSFEYIKIRFCCCFVFKNFILPGTERTD